MASTDKYSSSPVVFESSSRAFRDPRSQYQFEHNTPSVSVLSPLVDLQFVDLHTLPQDVVRFAESHADMLARYGLYLDYHPYIGLRHNAIPTECPVMVRHIYSLCYDQLSDQLEPEYIEV